MSELKSLTLKDKTYDSFVDQTARKAIEGLEQNGNCSLLVVTFTDENGTYTPSHTYSQIKEWVDKGGSAVLTDGKNWYNLSVVNGSQVWFERTVANEEKVQYVRYIITIMGKMDKTVSEYENGGDPVELDTTLTQSGKAADAKAVGDALDELETKIPEGSGGVSDYTELTNKPKINGVELSGDKTSADYGIGNPTNEQVAASVEAWLDEHPEATTTVADGSVNPDKTTWMRQVFHNIFNPNDPDLKDGYYFFTHANANLTGGGTANYFATGYIPVTGGKRYYINPKENVKVFDETKTFISTINHYGGIVEIPVGAMYMRFSTSKGNATPDTTQVYEYIGEDWEFDTYKNLYSVVVTDAGYSKAIADLVEGKFVDGSLSPADLFADESLRYKQMKGWKEFHWNIVDPATVTRTQPNQHYRYLTDFIKVEPGMILRGNWTYNFYDENKEAVSSQSAFYDGGVHDVIAPDGVAFVQVDSGYTPSETNTIKILTPGYGKSPSYVDEIDYDTCFPVFTDEDSKEGFKHYLGIYPWADKTFSFIGDSFTAPGTWCGIMVDNLKGAWGHNYAVSGANFSDADGVPKTAYEQAQEMVEGDKTPDVILITLGTNDANNSRTIGNIVESNSISDFDLTTYTGGMQACLNYLQNNFPDAIIYVGWTPMGGLVKGTKAEYITRMQEVCLMYGVEYIETRTCGVTRFSDVYAECYEAGANGGHPTGAGQQKIGAYMTRLMKSKL